MLGFVGSTGSTTISYILPGFFFLKLFNRDSTDEEMISRKQLIMMRLGAKVLVVVGLVIMVVCLSLNVRDVLR